MTVFRRHTDAPPIGAGWAGSLSAVEQLRPQIETIADELLDLIDTSSPVWLDNGVAVLVREKGNCCSIVSVSLSDGGQTPIGTLSGVGEAYVVSDPGQKTYMASTGTGETVAIDPAGKVTPIVGPTLGVVSCVTLTTTHL